MIEKITIRKAIQSDSADIAKLMDNLGSHIPPSRSVTFVQDRLSQFSTGNSDCIFVAECEGQVIGLLGFHITPLLHMDGYSGRITALIIDEKYRGQGIGTRLIRRAEHWAWSHNCVQIEVTSGDHHAPAHDFYKSQGYRSDDRRFVKEEHN